VQPSLTLITDEEQMVTPLFQQIANLSKQNRNLRRTRDLLLPKFISGEIDVEKLDIKMPAENGAAVAIATV